MGCWLNAKAPRSQIGDDDACVKTELRNVTDMADISVKKYWKVGVKSAEDHIVS